MSKLPTFGYGAGGHGQGPGYGKLSNFGGWLKGFGGHDKSDWAGALYDTFARQHVQAVGGAIQRFNPVQNIVNYSYANPVLGKVQSLRYNLQLRRDETSNAGEPANQAQQTYGRGSSGGGGPVQASYGGGDGIGGGGGGDDEGPGGANKPTGSAKAIIEALKSLSESFREDIFQVTTGLSEIKKSLDDIDQGMTGNTKAINTMGSQLAELVSIMKDSAERDKFSSAERNIEGGEKSQLGDLLGADGAEVKKDSKLRSLMDVVMLGATELLASVTAFFGKTGKLIKSFRITDILKPLGEFTEGLTKAFRFARFAEFLDMIPIIGEVAIVFFGLIDGIRGFLKGFKESKGNIIEKSVNGFVEALKEIFKGLAEPFKILADFIVNLLDKIPGFKDFRTNAESKTKQAAAFATEKAIETVQNVVQGPSSKLAPKTVLERAQRISAIKAEAVRQGLDPDVAANVAMIENNRFDPMAQPMRHGKALSSATGQFQILNKTWSRLGGTKEDRYDITAQNKYGVKNLVQAKDDLRKALGREPKPWEIYLAHQQGTAGALKALRANPNANAISILGHDEVVNNGGHEDTTIGEFLGTWQKRYDKAGSAISRIEAGAAFVTPTKSTIAPAPAAASQQVNGLKSGRQLPKYPLISAPSVQVNNSPTSVTNVSQNGSKGYPDLSFDRRGFDSASWF